MRATLLLCTLLLAAFVYIGCSEDSMITDHKSIDSEVELRSNTVDLCHYNAGNDSWHVISVNENAVPAHVRNHGDVILIDEDGDGYVTEENECLPTDCDDTDPNLTDNCCPIECCVCPYLDMSFGYTCYVVPFPGTILVYQGADNYGILVADNGLCLVQLSSGEFVLDGSSSQDCVDTVLAFVQANSIPECAAVPNAASNSLFDFIEKQRMEKGN